MAAMVCALGLLNGGSAFSQNSSGDSTARAGAWDRSVALERAGKIAEAREVLVRGWGAMPNSYDVAARLAWLALRERDYERAVSLYRAAQGLPGNNAETRQGLASALTALGYARMERSENDTAAAAFQEALSLDGARDDAREGLRLLVERRPRFDAWLGYIHKTLGSSQYRGGAGLAHVVWHLGHRFALRLAYRYAQLQEMGTYGHAAAARDRALGWSSHEVYASLAWTGKDFGLELMPMAIVPSDDGGSCGAAARAWAGRRFGASVEGAVLRRPDSSNAQALPLVYAWPWKPLEVHAGPRITRVRDETSISWTAGVSVIAAPLMLSLSGHLGDEHWPITMGAPAVLTVGETLVAGVTGAAVYTVGEGLRVGVVGTYERTRLSDLSGTYWAASLGASFSPAL